MQQSPLTNTTVTPKSVKINPSSQNLKMLRRKLLWAEKKAVKTGHYKSRVKVEILKRKIIEEEMLELLLL